MLAVRGSGLFHWIIDFITWPISSVIANPPRMHLLPFGNSPEIGLGLYSTMAAVVIGETVSFGAGMAVYWLHK